MIVNEKTKTIDKYYESSLSDIYIRIDLFVYRRMTYSYIHSWKLVIYRMFDQRLGLKLGKVYCFHNSRWNLGHCESFW